jgi:hypothetical protein
MLFYVKKNVWLDLAVTLLLGGVGLLGMRFFRLPAPVWSPHALLLGIAGFILLAGWTLTVQLGYRLVRGPAYAHELTAALARQFQNATPGTMLFGGATAAFGEELFFRGFLQQAFGLWAGALAFTACHFGAKDIRVISYWSLAQGIWLGLFLRATGNVLVPMVAHGLFDIGGMIYFRWFLAQPAPA